MDAFRAHERITDQYQTYLQSFIQVKDQRIDEYVGEQIQEVRFLPKPLLQFNPSFKTGQKLHTLEGVHDDLPKIFGDYNLYYHQIDALKKGIAGESFVVTSGTGSGKSLTFLGTIFNDLLQRESSERGIKAILVYPMNALINSQEEEIQKYEINYLNEQVSEEDLSPEEQNLLDSEETTLKDKVELLRSKAKKQFPISYAKYTGQESGDIKDAIKNKPTDILLTNYMMLELIMTRFGEQPIRSSMREHLKYLVFDELHTYRGRQGADVSMLIRRIQALASNKDLICIGTSATMASGNREQDEKAEVAKVASTIFAKNFSKDQIIGECTLQGREHRVFALGAGRGADLYPIAPKQTQARQRLRPAGRGIAYHKPLGATAAQPQEGG